MASTRFIRTLDELGPGTSLCHLYETAAQHQAILTAFVHQGLQCGERVLYILDMHTIDTILGYLQGTSLQIDLYLASGQLVFHTADDVCMSGGVFDLDAMIAWISAEMKYTLAEGYTALRATGEMSWALSGLPGSERLAEYEARLSNAVAGNQCLFISQYDMRYFRPETVLRAVAPHPYILLGTEIRENHAPQEDSDVWAFSGFSEPSVGSLKRLGESTVSENDSRSANQARWLY